MILQEPRDDELLHLLREGDRAAFSKIYRSHWENLYNTAYKRLKDKEYCEDIVQIVFTDLWRRREDVFIENLPAYLHTAVRFQVLKHISRRPRRCEFLNEFEVLITSSVHTDDELLEKEILNLIKLWIEALPRKRKAIFLMHINEDLSTREIANRLGISKKTVQNQLNTAMTGLRARLSQLLLTLSVLLNA